VSDSLPNVTVIIAARPGQDAIKAVPAARALEYPREKLNVVVARGKQPSAQRNSALKAATGEWVYFLDDDSEPLHDNLARAASYLKDSQVKMVGGPNVCPPEAPALQKTFALVLGSWLAFGPSRARYTPVGQVRETSEKELILCNLMAHRQTMLELGGFDESLYPNEENALMDELQRRGGKLIYDPQFVVQRHPRPTLGAFARMLRTYGRGRAEQFRLHPTFGSALNFVPPLFCLFLLALPWLGILGLAVLALYLLCVLAQVGLLLIASRQPLTSLGAGPLIILSHIMYGLGFWYGLFTQLKKQSTQSPTPPVVLEYP
jgi:succinoglycan biosynthesis protein ExoA